MSGELWLGVDLGTQGVKVVVVDDRGRVRATGTAPLHSRRDGVRHEQDPDDWWRATAEALREAGRAVALADVAGLAVDATSGTITLLDAEGRTQAPGLMYDDARAVEEAARVNDLGAEQWAAGGYQRMQRSWGLPKLVWLLGHTETAGTVLAHQSDVVNRHLVGHPVATDTSNALKSGVDVAAAAWPRAVTDALGVPAAMLPDVVLPGTVLGQVCATAAELTGLRAGTPVVGGTTDGCAAQIASGATDTGDVSSVLGTTLVLKGVSDTTLQDPHGVVYCHRSPDGRWLPGGASSSGAGLVARELPDVDLDALSAQAAALLPTDLLRYPLVSPGERFPFVAPEATDLSTRAATGPADVLASVMQGTAYVERLCLDTLGAMGAPVTGRVVLSGGASRNRVWSQLRADVLGRPVELLANPQPALGMAVLARAAVTHAGSGLVGTSALSDTVAQMVSVEEVLEHREAASAAHADGYARFVAWLGEQGWVDAQTGSAAAGSPAGSPVGTPVGTTGVSR